MPSRKIPFAYGVPQARRDLILHWEGLKYPAIHPRPDDSRAPKNEMPEILNPVYAPAIAYDFFVHYIYSPIKVKKFLIKIDAILKCQENQGFAGVF